MTFAVKDATGAIPGAPGGAGARQAGKLVGTLWYNMLSEMEKTGLNSSPLGSGASAYQGMFLWQVAQDDFSKYSSSLVSDIVRQNHLSGGAPESTHAAGDRLERMTTAEPELPSGPAAPSTSGVADGLAVSGESEKFAREVWPAVKLAASMLGVPPVGLLAQAALESGWGASAPGNNLFGVKSDGAEPSTTLATHEMEMGQMVPATAAFRNYGSVQTGLADYVSVVRARFPNVVGQESVEGFARTLQADGYATDGNYAEKIIGIARSPMMNRVLGMLGESEALNAP